MALPLRRSDRPRPGAVLRLVRGEPPDPRRRRHPATSGAPPALLARLEAQEGLFESPFRENLLFVKTSAQPRPGHQMEVTYNWRDETDIRGFGSQSSFEAAANVRSRVDSVLGKWQIRRTWGRPASTR